MGLSFSLLVINNYSKVTVNTSIKKMEMIFKPSVHVKCNVFIYFMCIN